MTLKAFIAAMQRNLFGSAWNPMARIAWCRKQRRQLGVPGHSVVWVRGETLLPWAQWGARRGYFDVEQMDGLSYLRPLGAPVV
jgi:hypothetical protein